MEPTRIELPSGNWVVLADPEKIAEGRRRRVMRALAKIDRSTASTFQALQAAQEAGGESPDVNFTPDEIDTLFEINDELAACLVSEWSCDIPLPATGETVQQLPASDYRALLAEVAPMFPALFPDFTPNPDPKVPTDNSNDSPGT